MKTIFTILALFVATLSFGQCHSDSTACKPSISGYVSYGLSMANSSDFKTSSYTGLEGGICYKNFSLGAIFGRGSLKGLGSSSDRISQYFYEVKATASIPMGMLTGSAFMGYGGYFGTSHNFIEYGLGMGYSVNKFTYGVACSNWDGINYLTPNITYNF